MSTLLAFKFLYSLLSFIGGSSLNQNVTFESLESKTSQGAIVFNTIAFKTSKKEDVWTMKQSHNGLHAKDWDEIKIVVDKESAPFKASYHQLKNGKEVEYKASCLRCHSSGPRLIRPNFQSKEIKLNIKEKLIVFNWNLLIKSYGNVEVKENSPFKRKVALIKDKKGMHESLNIKSCTKCHRESGERSVLTKANLNTIKFLVKKKMMPPWPYKISKQDKKELNKFMYGF